MNDNLKQRAKSLRRNQTDVEDRLWYYLRGKRFYGIKFKRQVIISNYIVDFASLTAKLVIEVDGGQHVSQKQYDQKRDEIIKRCGFTVLRFWNNEVLENIDGVLTVIRNKLIEKGITLKPPVS
jgi:very-short-patch-repair endonuclease